MPKFSAGLHKDVSKIFDGVAIPKKNAAEAVVSQNRTKVSALSSASQSVGRSGSMNREKIPENNLKNKPSSPALSKIKSRFSTIFHFESSPKQKMMAGLIPILLIVLIWVIGRAFNTNPTRIIKAGTFDPVLTPAVSVKDKWQIPEKYTAGLRDPMQYDSAPSQSDPAEEQQNSYDKIIVRGIVYSDDHPTAIIGSEIVGVGAKVYGATVTKINANSVEFQINDKVWTQTVQN